MLKCMAQCFCNNVSGICSPGCGAKDKAWSTAGSKCSVDSDVNIFKNKEEINRNKIIIELLTKSVNNNVR